MPKLINFYRCPDCKHTFKKPEDIEENDNIVCPGCKTNWISIFYIQLQGTSVDNACSN